MATPAPPSRRRRRIAALVLLWLAGMTAPLLAQPVNDAAELNRLKARADSGDAEAQYNLGFQYALGVPNKKGERVPDLKQAVTWYTKAADQGNIQAQYRLAFCYLKGEGVVRPDEEKALQQLRKAARNGLPEAQYDYAVLLYEYKLRTGKRYENEDSMDYFTLAANNGRGIPMAQLRLSKSYISSETLVQKYQWALIAARNGCIDDWLTTEMNDRKKRQEKKELFEIDRRKEQAWIAAEKLAEEFFKDPARTKGP